MAKRVKHHDLYRHHQNWSSKEEDLLRRLYLTTLAKELAVKLGRTEGSIRSKVRRLNIRKAPEYQYTSAPKIWSAKETKKLRKLWLQEYSIAEIAEIMGRSKGGVKGQIRKQIREFGLEKRFEPGKSWSKKEIAYLTKHYQYKSLKQLSTALGRTTGSIQGKAAKLNLMDEGAKPWTVKEINIVKKGYKCRPTAEIAKELGRTADAIRTKATLLGLCKSLTYWSDEEIKKLRKLWRQGYTKPQLVEILNKDINAVSNQIAKQIREFGLPKRNEFELWSKKEDKYLIQHYHKKEPHEIAEILGRTRAAIVSRAVLLKITKPLKWTENEINILKKYYHQWTTEQLVRKLGKNRMSIWQKANKLGLKMSKS